MTLRTERTTVKRAPERGVYDFETIARILDEGLVCHVGFEVDGQPFVVPTGYGRDGRRLYIHGSSVSRTQKALAGGAPVCVTVTILDGLVFARSAFHNSMNYRSVVILGMAQQVPENEKAAALRTISEHIMPGRWSDVRPPSPKELKATAVLKLDISEASAKVRSGPPKDDDEDLAVGCWAGELPFAIAPQEPVPDSHTPAGADVPAYVAAYRRPGAR